MVGNLKTVSSITEDLNSLGPNITEDFTLFMSEINRELKNF